MAIAALAAGMDCSGLSLTLLPNPSDDPNLDAQVDAGGNLIVVDSDCDGFAPADLDGSGTEDPDSVNVNFVWSEDGVELATGMVAVVELGEGLHNVTLTIVDEFGNETTQEIIVAVVPGSECGADPSPTPGGTGWTTTGALNIARDSHTATLLDDGRVLVAGGRTAINDGVHEFTKTCESYNPDLGTWSMTTNFVGPARYSHQAIKLPNGTVLIVGGTLKKVVHPWFVEHTTSCELFDPVANTWTLTGAMQTVRAAHSLTLLADGRVLAVGGTSLRTGENADWLSSCEIYDPAAGTWSATGSLNEARGGHGSVVLDDGKVLMGGGGHSLSSCELYDPQTGNWSMAAEMNVGRLLNEESFAKLSGGRILVAGGRTDQAVLSSCEVYDQGTDSWSFVGSLNEPSDVPQIAALPDGSVLRAAGWPGGESVTNSSERYDPATESWSIQGHLTESHGNHTVTILQDGRALVAGGLSLIDWPNNNTWTRVCEIYTP
jgi:hypothetical protein